MQNDKSARLFTASCRARCGAILAWLVQGFSIDVRSLAAFRVAMASMVLVDLAERLPDLTAHYTDAGVLPRAARVAMQSNGSSAAGRWAWSLHNASGTTAGQLVLFLAAAGFAAAMLVGYRTRLATVACWFFAVSIYYRNPMLEDAGDFILHTVLFWSMFLPLDAAASIDRLLKQAAASAPRQIVSLPGAALLLQICMIYWAAAAEKQSPVWLSEHTALYYTLSLDAFATPLGHRLLAFPQMLKWLTASIYWLEWLGPAVVILPLKWGLPRLLVVLAFWSMHLGIALTMQLGALPWISMAIWTVFLPGAFWDRCVPLSVRGLAGARFCRQRPLWRSANFELTSLGSARNAKEGAGYRPSGEPLSRAAAVLGRVLHHHASYRPSGKTTSALVAMLSLYTIVWNINQVTGSLEGRLPPQWKVPAYVLCLEQTWRMFAPFPLTDDGWYEMRGVLADGSVVNLWEPERPVARSKPADVAATYHNRRWRKYLVELRVRWAWFVPEFVDWLTRRWNGQYAADSPSRRVKHIDIIYHLEQTLSPERSSSLIVPEIVYEGDVPDNLLALPQRDN